MDLAQSAMTLGTWGLAIGSLPQLIKLLAKNPEPITGVSLEWAIATFCSLLFIFMSFFLTGWWLSLIAQIPPLVTWGLTTYRVWKQEND